MKKLLLPIMLLTPISASAMGIHISPEVKAGIMLGSGIQLGVTDVWGLEAVYGSYHYMSETNSVYDHSSKAYRMGVQKMFGQNKRFGFQAEIGYAEYEGTRDSWSETKHRTAESVSIGGAYVYQATDSIGLRAGMDINLYGIGNAYFAYGAQPSFSLGAIFHF
ncbi:hypothetical protein L4C54_14385 [Vibrio lamellibrachiae]|uniref:hypothetical protein n=1 Tax=Vibrio lamellibrachiae TaxID=2910253 RepID=UPI003D142FC4